MRKIKIIDVSSIQHPIIECGAAGTCDDATGTEDAVLLPDHAGYPGIPIEFTHKRSDTGIRTRQNMMHRKANRRQVHQQACDPYQQLPDADWATGF